MILTDRWRTLLCWLVAALMLGGALAPDMAWADSRRDAKRSFRRGMALIRKGQTDRGVAELRKAYRLKPHPNVLFNIARAYDVAGRKEDALQAYQDYVAVNPGEAPLARRRLAALEAELAPKPQAPAPPSTAPPDKSAVAPPSPAAPRKPLVNAKTAAQALLDAADAWEARAQQLEASPSATPSVSPQRSAPPAAMAPPEPDRPSTVAAAGLDALGSMLGATPGIAEPTAADAEGDFYARTVVSASRTSRSAVFAPASVSIITDEDIASSGARTIPDLLRRVAGIDVVAMSASDQNVSIRGFNQRVSNRVLVLVDGRSVYQDFLGATFWTTLPFNLEDIERIEVIRGPGAALYGANAVVGIINIITRQPGEGLAAGGRVTVGWPLLADASMRGSLRRGPLAVALSAGYVRQRKWAQELNRTRRDAEPTFGNIPFDLSAEVLRTDAIAQLRPASWLKLTGRAGVARTTQEVYAIGALRNFYLDGYFWNLSLEAEAGPLKLRGFYNGGRARVGPQIKAVASRESLTQLVSDVVDVEGTYTTGFQLGGRHRVVVGASYRLKSVSWGFLGSPKLEHHGGVFGEDTWEGPGGHRLVVSGRVDRHPLVGVLPSARGAFVFRAGRSSAIRAVLGTAFRNPTFLESYLEATPATPVAGVSIHSVGNRGLRPEQNIMAEIGYSNEVGDVFTTDVSVYFGRLRGLIVQGPLGPPSDGRTYDPATSSFIAGESQFLNDNEAYAQVGGEASITANPIEGVDLYANVAYLRVVAENAAVYYIQTPALKANSGARWRTPIGLTVSADGHLVSRAIWAERTFAPDVPGGVKVERLEVPPYLLVEWRAGWRTPGDNLEVFIKSDNAVGILPLDTPQRLEGTPLAPASPYLGPVMAHREHPFANPSGARLMVGVSGGI